MALFSRKAENKVRLIISIPPDGGFGWVVLAAAVFLTFITDGCIMTFGIYVPAFQKQLQVNTMKVKLIYSAQMGAYLLSGPFISLMIQRFGFRVVSFTGVSLCAIGYSLASQTQDYLLTVLTYGLMGGLGGGMAFAPSAIIVSYYFEKYRGIANGILYCGTASGGLVVASVFQRLLEEYGLDRTLLMQGCFASVALLGVLAFKPPSASEIVVDDNDFALAQMSLEQVSNGVEMRQFQSVYHPVVAQVEPPPSCWRRHCGCFRAIFWPADEGPDAQAAKTIRLGPMDRQDIYFGGSMAELNTLTQHSLDRVEKVSDAERIAKCTCDCCPEAFSQTMHRLFDPQLLKSSTFLVLMAALFVWMIGLYVPYIVLPERAIASGIEMQRSLQLLPIISIGSIAGRIVAGLISFTPALEPTWMVAIATILSGWLTVISALVAVDNLVAQIGFAIAYGFMMAFFMVLRSILCVKYMGLESLTSAYGITSMVMGIGAIIGSPIAEQIRVGGGGYRGAFLFVGVCHIVSGLLVIVMKYVHEWERRRRF